jgi:hypothetical protein
MEKIKNLYCNGSSLSAGGGLYDRHIKDEYKKLYNVEWENEKNVTYAKYVSDYYDLKLIHKAECGSGSPRLIRETYNFIKKIGIEEAKKTLFLFEITDPIHRIDMYCKEIHDHIIVNVRYDGRDDGSLSDLSIVHSYSPNFSKYENEKFKGKLENNLKNYLDDFHDPIVYTEKIKYELIGLFLFLEKIEVPFYYMFDTFTLKEPFFLYNELDKKHKVIIDENIHNSSHFCHKNKLTIKDELNGFSDDTHPGYFGYKKFSEKLIEFLNSRAIFTV